MPSRTGLAKGIPIRKAKHPRLSSTNNGYTDFQLKKSHPPKVPYKATGLGAVLFLIGAFLIIVDCLLLAGSISKGVGGQTAIPILVTGIPVFLPGVYHLRMHCWLCIQRPLGLLLR
ncbi:transmembrane protein 230-like [Phyllostomus discolor]|uniref:Transmembrane protein 230 n=1 Tax=Phyllostomus discolor TaxID=89673 RepID=A0A7E6EG17_9CHIR|nr:transmembrane protein 230-like [Phyllostomus discolor]